MKMVPLIMFPNGMAYGLPLGLLEDAGRGDANAMREAAKYLLDHGGPDDKERAFGFLHLAHACERNQLAVQHIDQVLNHCDRPVAKAVSNERLLSRSASVPPLLQGYLSSVVSAIP